MAIPASSDGAPRAIEALLRDELVAADRLIANNGPILAHLLRSDDNSIFSDEIVARVRGMFHDLARQLVMALAEAAGQGDPQEWAQAGADELSARLIADRALLAHLHALSLEWQLTERLEGRIALDPVLPPLLQARIAAGDAVASATAMNLLAAQARFGQAQRRMQLSVAELPAPLLAAAVRALGAVAGEGEEAQRITALAAQRLRQRSEPGRNRLVLIDQVLASMPGVEAAQALSIENAGVAIFLSALAAGAGLTREMAVMATTETQFSRLALALGACGVGAEAVTAQFMALHPDIGLPEGLGALHPDRAAAILAEAANDG
ncbi:hypothetical protein [Novosphingobium huizhouense]|uniref:hypothetical protein n=1 Tax=Novosphingobium huizhouense TaxID=2866625 RepID=UPI001CD90F41|nr:hypothetical protein [Novosphingobium huizhouense]